MYIHAYLHSYIHTYIINILVSCPLVCMSLSTYQVWLEVSYFLIL